MGENLSDLFDDPDFGHADFTGATSPEDLFSILESLEEATKDIIAPFSPFAAARENDVEPLTGAGVVDRASTPSTVKPRNETGAADDDGDEDDDTSAPRKRRKLAAQPNALVEAVVQDGQNKVSHITVERNRRKQMNEHLLVLRSLMPCFYVKRGDQASVIGGVVDYIKELQQLLQSLESKKQRKAYSEGLSPRTATSPRPPPPSPRPSPLSPRPSPLSPRVGLPISPRTPQPGSPYKPRPQPAAYLSPTMPPYSESPPSFDGGGGELAANSKSTVADVEVKFSGPNVLLKTASHRIPGQALKIITALEGLSLEILHVSISAIDETMLYAFTIKIGIECELSAEDLAHEIQQTFS